ncbi:PiggyBac transposable element-derived protein 4-like [Plakobranchus ocellatus]|uniref:PiggyBac transposable element-derived protein 4-like n=1 Tax=Plakobranchus ocellatus TaxID=259542 RepID=A0AAV4CAJ1_9GAST|nr:PiggyBac transposable element-derived protein 4-like [Plakobranchus ocellatus]
MFTFEIYKDTSDPGDRHEEVVTYTVVMRLMNTSNPLHMGYHLGLDYFTSPKLLFDLFSCHTPSTVTVTKNRKGLPQSVVKAKLAKYDVAVWCKGTLFCGAYKGNTHQPTFLSTYGTKGNTETTNTKGKTQTSPTIISEYNRAMGANIGRTDNIRNKPTHHAKFPTPPFVYSSVFQLYPEQRSILVDEADLTVLGSTIMKTSEQRKILEERHSVPIMLHSAYNLQQKMGVGRVNGDKDDVKCEAIIRDIMADHGYGEVGWDEEGVVQYCCFTTTVMKGMLQA